MDYESWDRIADAITPTVGVITLALSVLRRRPGNPPRWAQLLLTLVSVGAVYAVGWADAQLKLWSGAGLDYSTHSGVYVALAVSLWMIDWRIGIAGAVIGAAYAVLMLYQRYHTPMDIVSTAAVVAPLCLGFWLVARRFWRRPTS
jgi:hypothetical protein